ncbi:MAG: type II toxin-antitoxin system HicA family toxin [Lachnospiraceae bacterium]|nr:type II toxin-antitoxin system HicA family toxin [Lachnospiraceae bacterium]
MNQCIDFCVISVYNIHYEEEVQRDLVKKLENGGFVFERHGGNHDIYRRGKNIEKVPRHKEINESLARLILRKWNLL